VRDVARELLANHAVGEVFVVAHEPYAEWFAQALTHSELENIFTSGGRVRAVRPHHITPYLAAHARKPDLALMLGSLFADYRPSVI
jgi:phosphohistidine phosphatase SixA